MAITDTPDPVYSGTIAIATDAVRAGDGPGAPNQLRLLVLSSWVPLGAKAPAQLHSRLETDAASHTLRTQTWWRLGVRVRDSVLSPLPHVPKSRPGDPHTTEWLTTY